jgi:hypothetical protein
MIAVEQSRNHTPHSHEHHEHHEHGNEKNEALSNTAISRSVELITSIAVRKITLSDTLKNSLQVGFQQEGYFYVDPRFRDKTEIESNKLLDKVLEKNLLVHAEDFTGLSRDTIAEHILLTPTIPFDQDDRIRAENIINDLSKEEFKVAPPRNDSLAYTFTFPDREIVIPYHELRMVFALSLADKIMRSQSDTQPTSLAEEVAKKLTKNGITFCNFRNADNPWILKNNFIIPVGHSAKCFNEQVNDGSISEEFYQPSGEEGSLNHGKLEVVNGKLKEELCPDHFQNAQDQLNNTEKIADAQFRFQNQVKLTLNQIDQNIPLIPTLHTLQNNFSSKTLSTKGAGTAPSSQSDTKISRSTRTSKFSEATTNYTDKGEKSGSKTQESKPSTQDARTGQGSRATLTYNSDKQARSAAVSMLVDQKSILSNNTIISNPNAYAKPTNRTSIKSLLKRTDSPQGPNIHTKNASDKKPISHPNTTQDTNNPRIPKKRPSLSPFTPFTSKESTISSSSRPATIPSITIGANLSKAFERKREEQKTTTQQEDTRNSVKSEQSAAKNITLETALPSNLSSKTEKTTIANEIKTPRREIQKEALLTSANQQRKTPIAVKTSNVKPLTAVEEINEYQREQAIYGSPAASRKQTKKSTNTDSPAPAVRQRGQTTTATLALSTDSEYLDFTNPHGVGDAFKKAWEETTAA